MSARAKEKGTGDSQAKPKGTAKAAGLRWDPSGEPWSPPAKLPTPLAHSSVQTVTGKRAAIGITIDDYVYHLTVVVGGEARSFPLGGTHAAAKVPERISPTSIELAPDERRALVKGRNAGKNCVFDVDLGTGEVVPLFAGERAASPTDVTYVGSHYLAALVDDRLVLLRREPAGGVVEVDSSKASGHGLVALEGTIVVVTSKKITVFGRSEDRLRAGKSLALPPAMVMYRASDHLGARNPKESVRLVHEAPSETKPARKSRATRLVVLDHLPPDRVVLDPAHNARVWNVGADGTVLFSVKASNDFGAVFPGGKTARYAFKKSVLPTGLGADGKIATCLEGNLLEGRPKLLDLESGEVRDAPVGDRKVRAFTVVRAGGLEGYLTIVGDRVRVVSPEDGTVWFECRHPGAAIMPAGPVGYLTGGLAADGIGGGEPPFTLHRVEGTPPALTATEMPLEIPGARFKGARWSTWTFGGRAYLRTLAKETWLALPE